MSSEKGNRYLRVLVHLFEKHYVEGSHEVVFAREEIAESCESLGIKLPKNIGDILYSFRYRNAFPSSITDKAPPGKVWQLVTIRRATYAFKAVSAIDLEPDPELERIHIPDATPGLISQHAMTSEQALLARVRYNRLIDIFTGVVCHSLQNHVRATVGDGIQIETDEIYLGIDGTGRRFVIPVEAKGGSDRLSTVQINQDLALAREKFPGLRVLLVGVQFANDGDVCMFLFEPEDSGDEAALIRQARYHLSPPESPAEEIFAKILNRN